MTKKTREDSKAMIKDKIRDYLANSWEDLIWDIDSLDPKERVDRRMKLMEYVMPKAAAVKTEEKAPTTIAQILLNQETQFGDYQEEEETETPDSDEISSIDGL